MTGIPRFDLRVLVEKIGHIQPEELEKVIEYADKLDADRRRNLEWIIREFGNGAMDMRVPLRVVVHGPYIDVCCRERYGDGSKWRIVMSLGKEALHGDASSLIQAAFMFCLGYSIGHARGTRGFSED